MRWLLLTAAVTVTTTHSTFQVRENDFPVSLRERVEAEEQAPAQVEVAAEAVEADVIVEGGEETMGRRRGRGRRRRRRRGKHRASATRGGGHTKSDRFWTRKLELSPRPGGTLHEPAASPDVPSRQAGDGCGGGVVAAAAVVVVVMVVGPNSRDVCE